MRKGAVSGQIDDKLNHLQKEMAPRAGFFLMNIATFAETRVIHNPCCVWRCLNIASIASTVAQTLKEGKKWGTVAWGAILATR